MILIKSVLSSLAIFYMSTMQIPITVIQQAEKYLKLCFWRKYGREDRGSALIKWEKVTLPKKQGGLGILNVRLWNMLY